jgi:Protein of unknown function (DUF998)
MNRPIVFQLAGRFAAGALILYQVILVVLIGLRPDLDPSWHTISEWAIGPWGFLMSAGFILSGLGYAGLATAVGPWLRKAGGRIGLGLLVVCAIGAVGVGCFTTDPLSANSVPQTPRGVAHLLFGTSQLVLFPWSALVVSLSLARNGLPGTPRWLLIAVGFVPLAGFLFFALYIAVFVAPLGNAYGPGVNIGWPPRLAFFCYMIWVVILGTSAARAVRRFL